MAATTRVKVKRETLLKQMQKERDRVVAKYERENEQYEQALDQFLVKLETAVDEFANLIGNDRDRALERMDSASYRGGVKITIPKLKLPREPHLDTQRLDRQIAVLEAAEDEVLSIAAEDEYARYL